MKTPIQYTYSYHSLDKNKEKYTNTTLMNNTNNHLHHNNLLIPNSLSSGIKLINDRLQNQVNSFGI